MTATPAEWPTIDEAAARLHMTRRNLDRYIRDRKIASREDPQPGRTRPVIRVCPGDIEEIARQQRRRMDVVKTGPVEVEGPAAPDGFGVLASLIGAAGDQISHRRLAQMEPDPAPRPFLTIAEASLYSGLPPRLLTRLIRQGAIPRLKHGKYTYVARASLDNIDMSGFHVAIPKKGRRN